MADKKNGRPKVRKDKESLAKIQANKSKGVGKPIP